jgi:predicted aldo/keto reductase-like oxidoreductase
MEDANRQPVYGAIIFRQQQGREVSYQEQDCPGCPFQVKIDNYLESIHKRINSPQSRKVRRGN